jgi:methyltransferase family protein
LNYKRERQKQHHSPERTMLIDRVKSLVRERFPSVHRATRAIRGQPLVLLNYPVDPRPRYGYGLPPHPELYRLINEGRSRYHRMICAFVSFGPDLLKIARTAGERDVSWTMEMLPPLDCAALYCFLRQYAPPRYFEVGSGFSTKVARRAIRDGNLPTKIISIDPTPRVDVDLECDEVIRNTLENTDLRWTERIMPGDILFVDDSHCCFPNSDVTVFFLEILPRLKPGVIVQVHDIALPYDYPPELRDRFYSEQYLLACCLLNSNNRFEILLPNSFVAVDPELLADFDWLLKSPVLARVPAKGMSFWFQIR